MECAAVSGLGAISVACSPIVAHSSSLKQYASVADLASTDLCKPLSIVRPLFPVRYPRVRRIVATSSKPRILMNGANPHACGSTRTPFSNAHPPSNLLDGLNVHDNGKPATSLHTYSNRRVVIAAAAEIGNADGVTPVGALGQSSSLVGVGGASKNGTPGSSVEDEAATAETIETIRAALVAAELRSAAAEKERRLVLDALAEAEAKAESYKASMVETTEAAVAEVEAAKDTFRAELEKVLKEKGDLEDQLTAAKEHSIDLAVKVERMAAIAVQEQTAHMMEEARLKIAAAETDAIDAAAQVQERIRRAADEAAASVIEEAKATIEDALAAAEIAKEQARAAENALRERMNVLDELAKTEEMLMKAEEEKSNLTLQLREGEAEKENLRLDIKAAIARAEAVESRILATQAQVAEMKVEAEKVAKDREAATKRALETMRAASAGREQSALLAYKAETESLRAAAQAAYKAEKVKEQAYARRFRALEQSLAAAEESAKAWKKRAMAVEELLVEISEKGFGLLKESGAIDDLLNRGRMEVMLGNQSQKWKLISEGPRRERPEWLLRKGTGGGVTLPPLLEVSDETQIPSLVPMELPKKEEVWSIADHTILDDVFTKETEKQLKEQAKIERQRVELEEQRQQLEKSMQRKTVIKRVKTPEELEDTKESGTGTGREIVFQGFNWESHRRKWYLELAPRAADLAACGITTVWLPPPTESVSPQGYMPVDLYNLNSAYGSKEELQFCIEEFHNHNILVLGDIVLNHRCASKQSSNGVWNIFGGKLSWGPDAIVRDDPNFQGRGNPSSGDFFHAAPNIDHSQEFVRRDIKELLIWFRTEIGYDGWRLDFARGFWGGFVKEYIEASKPAFAIGEYWDSLAYEGGTVCYNQDGHRQRIINWINATGGTSSAFDVTTKGILHSALHNEYWRLIDPKGKPPGVMGWWPSRAVTFLENHDTGSTQGHWPFPRNKLMQGYAYILTHPGTPVIFYDHFYDFGLHDQIAELIAARNHCGIHCRSSVRIFHANAQGYVAQCGDNLVLKLGTFDWNPYKQNNLVGRWERFLEHGHDYQIWEKVG